MANIGSGTGIGGKSFQDRELAARVRTLALNQVWSVLNERKLRGEDTGLEYHKALLMKMAGTILPRLQEHSGADGGALVISYDPSFKNKNETPPETTTDN